MMSQAVAPYPTINHSMYRKPAVLIGRFALLIFNKGNNNEKNTPFTLFILRRTS